MGLPRVPHSGDGMSMSTYLIGIKPKDENWHRMRMILELCERGKVQAPAEVLKYFEGAPDRSDDGVLVYLSDAKSMCLILRKASMWTCRS